VSLQAAHSIDYLLGDAESLRGRAARVLGAWSPADPGYHAVLAMLAFGLGECGEHEAAQACGHRALELNPGDFRAFHAVAHSLEMRGLALEGIRWMDGSRSPWAGTLATHLWWHLALYHLQRGDLVAALALYDTRVARVPAPQLSELTDASALLWRLQLRGADLGARWIRLAAHWAPRAEDAYCAFNDLHAMMAFAASGRRDLSGRLLQALRSRLARGGTNHGMTRFVGIPACRALLAFAEGDDALAARLLAALPAVAHRIGGSHAQRDVLALTLAAAQSRMLRRAA
jgi:tetratricopeptide (TPR) repeat protein